MLYINHFVVQGSVDRVLLDQKGERMLQMYKKDVRYYKKAGRVEENITLPEILPQAGLPAGIRRRDHIIAEGFIRAFGQRDYLSDRYLVSQVLIGQKYTFDTPVISRVSGIEGIGRSYDDASAYAVVAGELIGVSARSPETPWKTLLARRRKAGISISPISFIRRPPAADRRTKASPDRPFDRDTRAAGVPLGRFILLDRLYKPPLLPGEGKGQ